MSKLRHCSDCGKEMSKRAKVCPHCGASNRYQYGVGRSLIVLILFFVLLGTIAVGAGRCHSAMLSAGTPPSASIR